MEGRRSTPGSVIEDSQHGDNAIGIAIGASDVAAGGSDVVHGQPNATRTFGYACTFFESVIDTLQLHSVTVTQTRPCNAVPKMCPVHE